MFSSNGFDIRAAGMSVSDVHTPTRSHALYEYPALQNLTRKWSVLEDMQQYNSFHGVIPVMQ
jgi:hypothetical protein